MRTLLASAVANDTFPGLPRPRQRVVIAVAPDRRRFREWAGAVAPEWGSALAFPQSRRVIMQGSAAASDAGNPTSVLRHELAHLALHEYMGELPPRWFDEGYASVAAREWDRDDLLATNFALAVRGMPTLAQLESSFEGGSSAAQSAYALAYRAVAELTALDPARGLSLLFRYWREDGSLDHALRSAYGITLADFERRWRDHTRHRYGALAFFSDLAVLGLLLVLVLTPLYLARRRRDRRRLAAMRVADAEAERKARESALADLLGSATSEVPGERDIEERS